MTIQKQKQNAAIARKFAFDLAEKLREELNPGREIHIYEFNCQFDEHTPDDEHTLDIVLINSDDPEKPRHLATLMPKPSCIEFYSYLDYATACGIAVIAQGGYSPAIFKLEGAGLTDTKPEGRRF